MTLSDLLWDLFAAVATIGILIALVIGCEKTFL